MKKLLINLCLLFFIATPTFADIPDEDEDLDALLTTEYVNQLTEKYEENGNINSLQKQSLKNIGVDNNYFTHKDTGIVTVPFQESNGSIKDALVIGTDGIAQRIDPSHPDAYNIVLLQAKMAKQKSENSHRSIANTILKWTGIDMRSKTSDDIFYSNTVGMINRHKLPTKQSQTPPPQNSARTGANSDPIISPHQESAKLEHFEKGRSSGNVAGSQLLKDSFEKEKDQ